MLESDRASLSRVFPSPGMRFGGFLGVPRYLLHVTALPWGGGVPFLLPTPPSVELWSLGGGDCSRGGGM